MIKHYVVFTKNGVSIDVYADYVKYNFLTSCNKDVIQFFNDDKAHSAVSHPVAEFYVDAIAGYGQVIS